MTDPIPAASAESPRLASLRREYLRWSHGTANVLWLLAMHAALLAWLWSGRALLPYPLFVASAVLASLVHQRVLSEWFHESTHWNLVPDRRWNDWLADLLIGPFNGTRVRSNRPGHFRHHADLGFFVAGDPDTCSSIAVTRREFIIGILRDVCHFSALRAFLQAARQRSTAGVAGAGGSVAWYGSLLVLHGAGLAVTIAGGRADIYPIYFLTLLSLYPIANRFRLYAQHAQVLSDGRVTVAGTRASRTVHAGLVEQLLLQSPMIMYHHEHHASPSLPYRALRAISRPSDDPNVFGRSGFPIAARAVASLN